MQWARGFVLSAVLGAGLSLTAQVMMPAELPDPSSQNLQQRYIKTLMAIGNEIEAHKFPYPFYFTRVLDVDREKMQAADQRSIRFDIYKGQSALEITGNYYAAYSGETMDAQSRLKETYKQVILPILQIEAAHFPDDSEFAEFAIEVSHHVRQKVMGVPAEHPENITVLIPVLVAQRLVDAKTDDERQSAILEAKIFLNGEPYSLWILDGNAPDDWKERAPPPKKQTPTSMRIYKPDDLSNLQRQNEETIGLITKQMEGEAHFLPYVQPTFIGFRQGAYLQFSIASHVNAPEGSSRYKLAALAFDEHISHLIRPMLTYFPVDADFDGITFSSTIHIADGTSPLAVEFFLPFRMMRCFASYDCTGQQLLDSGTIVFNGERGSLDLQVAEGKN
jgi:hypothetical protein